MIRLNIFFFFFNLCDVFSDLEVVFLCCHKCKICIHQSKNMLQLDHSVSFYTN